MRATEPPAPQTKGDFIRKIPLNCRQPTLKSHCWEYNATKILHYNPKYGEIFLRLDWDPKMRLGKHVLVTGGAGCNVDWTLPKCKPRLAGRSG